MENISYIIDVVVKFVNVVGLGTTLVFASMVVLFPVLRWIVTRNDK